MQFWKPSTTTEPQLEIGAGSGLEDRIRLLFGAVTISLLESPQTIQLGAELVRDCMGQDDLCEVQAIFNGLRRRFEYRGDPRTFNAFHTVRRTLQMGAANCASATVALCAVLSGQEFNVGARCFEQWEPEVGRWDFDHVCGIVELPRYATVLSRPRTMTLDLGMPSHRQTKPGWQLPRSEVRNTRDYWYVPEVWHRWYTTTDWGKTPSERGNILAGMPRVRPGKPR